MVFHIDEFAEIGAEIGSDVSFCVYGGTALAKGRGEKITHLPAPPKCWVILAKPTIGVSTADVYKRLQISKMEHPDVHWNDFELLRKMIIKMCVKDWGMCLEASDIAVISRSCEY